MKFSSQEEYGLRCLLTIARSETGSATIPEISRAEQLSESHVAKLLMILRKEGIVASARGHSGGYTLVRPAEELLVGDVLAALGGRLYDEDYCGKHTGLSDACVHGSGCSLSDLWNSIQEAVDTVTYRVTLQDLARGGSEMRSVQLRPAVPSAVRKKTLARSTS
jgi:Rrf2 family protein